MQSRNIVKESRRRKLLQLLAELNVQEIDEPLAQKLMAQLQPISGSYFRKLLRESEFILSPLVEGVRQETRESLERTLLVLLDAPEKEARTEVLEARRHALLAQQKNPTPEREEKILWLTIWLENRELFPEWLNLRKRQLDKDIPHDTSRNVS